MPLRPEHEIPGNMRRAMARVDVLRRTLATKRKRASEMEPLFSESQSSFSGQSRSWPSLGKFNTVNATFRWGNLAPSSGLREAPILYMEERDCHDSHRCSGVSSPADSSGDEVSSSESSEPSTSPPGLKRCRPIESESDLSLVEPFYKIHLVCNHNHPTSVREVPCHASNPGDLRYHGDGRSRSVCVGRPTLYADSDNVDSSLIPIKSPPTNPMPPTSPAQMTMEDDLRRNPDEWQRYALVGPDPDKPGKTNWKCKWMLEDGSECYYRAKKQLMKRHVENVHLALKRFRCTYCPERYGQKTSLDVHIATHTGEAFKTCPYENCNMKFRDPARLHRHKMYDHGYIPKPTVRQRKPRAALLAGKN